MSHHLSGPDLRSPGDDARLDLTDVFAFTAPSGDRTVLIMNVNPFAPTRGEHFHPDAVYRINVDTDGDSQADVAFSFVFSPPVDGGQTVSVHRSLGRRAQSHEPGVERLVADAPVSFGSDPAIVTAGGLTFSAGIRSDPFFADLDGIVHDFQWTGRDSMADQNVFGIVLEMPNAELGSNPLIGVWARVSLRRDGQLVSMDRGAHPSLTAYFNSEDAKDTYNAREPADDWENYRDAWTAVLQHTGGYGVEDAHRVLRQVLPDILRYDRSRPVAYPNGRKLTDDVTSARLNMVSGGRITTDHIGPHHDLLDRFPYLGNPHPVGAAAMSG
ncbi:DUF4331 family protein [Saccharopolyspora erythraea]|uniref:DUF4331 family protein n=1 Tax=Saccharopolyspora erythraea TaxID=1836 RepID=UPI001BA8C1CF|nr:DUF4331 family protein [Saccharopolyspora erythraea]QUH02544.1 DUF4331 family protein [Saccharopolyspora erythraea]